MTFGSHDDKPSGSEPVKVCRSLTETSRADFVVVHVHQEEPGKSNQPKSETHSEVGDGKLIEVSVRSFPN